MSESKDPLQQIYRIIIGLTIIGFVYVIWPYISTVVVMLVLAFLFTTILLPGVDYLERKIKSRGLSVFIMTIIVIVVISVFLGGFTSGLVKQAKEFSSQLNKDDYISDLNSFAEKAVNSLPEFVRDIIPKTGNMADKLQGQVSEILQNLLSFAGAVGSFLFTVVMVIIFTVIILYGYYHFRKSLVRFIPNKYFEIGLRLIFNIERSVSSYLRGQLMAATSVAILSIIGLIILNVFGANLTLIVFIGIIAGLANLIPLVGPVVGMVPAILIAFMNNLGNDIALGHKLFGIVLSPFFIFDIILMFLIVQQIDNNYITPKVVGESVGLHPILVMIALLIGGTLLGPLGMLFAVPTAGVIKVVGQEIAFVSRNAHLL